MRYDPERDLVITESGLHVSGIYIDRHFEMLDGGLLHSADGMEYRFRRIGPDSMEITMTNPMAEVMVEAARMGIPSLRLRPVVREYSAPPREPLPTEPELIERRART